MAGIRAQRATNYSQNSALVARFSRTQQRFQRAPGLGIKYKAAVAHKASYVDASEPSVRSHPIMAWNCDWDDNIFNMPTKIWLYERDGDGVKQVSTKDWTWVKRLVSHQGQPAPERAGEWAKWEIRTPDSLRFFENDHFADDVKRRIEAGPGWQGPSWAAFVKAMSTKETAERTTIITARLHAPEIIFKGLLMLQEMGLIKHVPGPVNDPPR